MPRIELEVPFAQKDEAKQLGAKWDGERKLWYVPDGVDGSVFGRWLPSAPDISIRSSSYFIALTTKACWKCSQNTRVYGFILPAGHEALELADADDEQEAWCRYDEPTIVHVVTNLLPNVVARIKALSNHYRVEFSKTAQSAYWMNHCEHCGIKQGDFEMYCEPQGAFFPMDARAASRILLHEFAEPFGCNGDMVYGEHFLEHMRRA